MPDIADRATRTREDRAFTVDDLEIREEGDGYTFDGVASSVDKSYTVRDSFGEFQETIVPGSFNRTIKQADDVRLLVNHTGVPMARTKSGTLRLSVTPDLRAVAPGLDPSNPTVQEIRSALARKDIDQMSIGMRVRDDVWNDDYTERTIREVQLFDVSIVTFPANPATSAAMRSLDELLADCRDWDEPSMRRAIAHLEAQLRAPQMLYPAALPVTDGPTAPHPAIDTAGDGTCDTCGMPLDGHVRLDGPQENAAAHDLTLLIQKHWDKRLTVA